MNEDWHILILINVIEDNTDTMSIKLILIIRKNQI